MTGRVVCFKIKKKRLSIKPSKDFTTARQVIKLTKSAPDFERNAADFVRL